MFIEFFYLLRQRGMDISLNEWVTLLTAMRSGLHRSSLNGFYTLCRSILIRSEAEYDRFDQVFSEYFKDVPFEGEISEQLMSWLNDPVEDLKRSFEDMRSKGIRDDSIEQLLKMLELRLKQQKEEHDGGNHWVGTQGYTPWGNNGWRPNGIRIGGNGNSRSAMAMASERQNKDFRKDNTLDIRSFQMAVRMLR